MSEALLQRSRQRRGFRPAFAKALRLEAQLTLADIGRDVHVTEATISRWENGIRRPRGPVAERYLALLSRLEAELRRG